jgi:predicted ATPase
MTFTRIVITGGPCAGKTHVVEELRHRFGDTMLVVPEVASMLLGNGYPRPSEEGFTDRWLDAFQSSVLSVQLNMENEYEHMARQRSIPLIIYDRGILDGAAYLGKGRDYFLKKNNLSLSEVTSRYDAVIHLESVAVSNPELYRALKESNPARYESPEEAMTRDMAIMDAWELHGNRTVISGKMGIDAVVAQVLIRVREEMGRYAIGP